MKTMQVTKILSSLLILLSLLSIGVTPATQNFRPSAKTWSMDVYTKDGLYYKATIDYSQTSGVKINSVTVTASMPGLRINGDVSVNVKAFSNGKLVKETNVIQPFGIGARGSTKTWTVISNSFQLTPSSASTYILVSIAGAYVSTVNGLTCGNGTGLCGTETLTFRFIK